jgi:hypothetical protein
MMQRPSSLRIVAYVFALLLPFASAAADDPRAHFFEKVQSPDHYVVEKLALHRVVIFGESHWVADEVELVAGVVPKLPSAGTRSLAVEFFPASMQELLDRVVTGDRWDEAAAMAVLRAAEMPYEEYLDIIQSVWSVNRERGPGTLALVALGPGLDWRQTLPPGETYETFMAAGIRRALEERGGSVLAYMGLHHAFSRYLQPETTDDGRVWRFMVRTGNLLWWEMGQALFVIGTHRPFQCRGDDGWTYCLPFDGQLDCASAASGTGPYGFDVAGSPFAGLRFDRRDIYAAGYPDLRLVDFVDGWIWFGPIDSLRPTRLIPLNRYAPDAESMAALRRANPLNGMQLQQAELESLWQERTEARIQPILHNRWQGLPNWREACGTQWREGQ